MIGRYGAATEALVSGAAPGELTRICGTPALWAELRYAAQAEQVQHLDDLLLRRTRLGLLLRHGAAEILPRVEQIARPLLGWDATRWQAEVVRYLDIVQRCYALPREATQDWSKHDDADPG